MKKLLAFLNTALGVVIVVGAVTLGVELLFMVFLHEVFIPILPYKLSDTAWGFIDAITLTVTISPALYFLVFRKMHESEELFRTLYETSRDAIMTLEPDDGFLGGNPATLTLFGCRDEQEFKCLSPSSTSPAFQPDGYRSDEKAQEMMMLALKTGSNFFEWTHRRMDGTEFYADVLLMRMEIDGKKLLQATVRDITVRKKNELLLAAVQRELQTAYDLIVRKNAQLQASIRARSEFLAAVSHELKTPLNHIIGFSELLKEGCAGPLTEEQRGFTQDIYHAGTKLLGLLSDIIDFANLEAGYTRLELKLVTADVWLIEIVMPWRERATASGLTFTLHIPEQLGTLRLDAVKVRQIVANLLSNAVKFTPNGGTVTLTARRVAQARLAGDILPDAFAEYLEIEVRDTGIGFPPELLHRLFEPFHQGDASLARQYEGVGLGLAMVKSLVDLHGGAVQAHNAPDHGACVTVWLPWRENAADQVNATSCSFK